MAKFQGKGSMKDVPAIVVIPENWRDNIQTMGKGKEQVVKLRCEVNTTAADEMGRNQQSDPRLDKHKYEKDGQTKSADSYLIFPVDAIEKIEKDAAYDKVDAKAKDGSVYGQVASIQSDVFVGKDPETGEKDWDRLRMVNDSIKPGPEFAEAVRDNMLNHQFDNSQAFRAQERAQRAADKAAKAPKPIVAENKLEQPPLPPEPQDEGPEF